MNTAPDLLSEDMAITPTVANHLSETAKWTRFVSIVVFIALGFVFLALLVGSALLIPVLEKAYPVFGNMGGLLFAIVGIVVASIGVITWFMLRFSILSIKALRTQQQAILQNAFAALRIYLLISGVLSILSLLTEIFNLLTAF